MNKIILYTKKIELYDSINKQIAILNNLLRAIIEHEQDDIEESYEQNSKLNQDNIDFN